MKKIFSILLISTFIFTPLLAHPGGIDKNGGHYCRKNCAKYGLKTNQYHCHKAKCKIK
jgi:hypothetical protein